MNEAHLKLCASAEWADAVRRYIVPWVTDSGSQPFGDDLLEVGPGPGETTAVLREMVPSLTAIELDAGLAEKLRVRFADSNVTVVEADATAMPFESARFSAAICLTMLHHVPTLADQDRLLAEMVRVVRPGGAVLGLDSLDSPDFRALHVDDVCVPVDPTTLQVRLEALGLTDIHIETNEYAVRFNARTPA